MSSPNHLKRTLAASEFPEAGPQSLVLSAPKMEFCHKVASIQSPTGSRASSPLSDAGPSTRENSTPPLAKDIQAPINAAKRRKLTHAEKEIQRIEKQFKEMQKAEQKAKKEEEKAKREDEKAKKEEEKARKEEEKRAKEEEAKEERKRKEEEKEDRRKARENEKQAKEEEKKKKDAERKAKEDEKAKREKSQLRLGSFFAKPIVQGERPLVDDRGRLFSRSGSVTSQDGLGSRDHSRSESARRERSNHLHYQQAFPAFFLHPHTKVAPSNRFHPEHGTIEERQERVDKLLVDVIEHPGVLNETTSLQQISPVFSGQGRRGKSRIISVKEIITQIHNSACHPIDLTGGKLLDAEKPLRLLTNIPVKYLKYAEDVRLPYIGTYTKRPEGILPSKLGRCPFARALPGTNYDYDSEAEWEEPEEGEDLDSEGEEDAEDEDGDDMDGFLDDDGADGGAKRRQLMGDVEPVCTRLHWETNDNDHGSRSRIVSYGPSAIDLESFRMDFLFESPPSSIDPFSTRYWQPDHERNDARETTTLSHDASQASMPPPRLPLHTVHGSNVLLPVPVQSGDRTDPLKPLPVSRVKAGPPARPMPPDLLPEFKKAVSGSDHTKLGLVEVLKKQFPQVSKNTIQVTLALVAVRVGRKEADKRWCLIG